MKNNIRGITIISSIILLTISIQMGFSQDFEIEETSFLTRTSSSTATKTRNAIMLSAVKNTSNLSKYGGNLDVKLEPTGHFRTEIYNGSWFLVDPDGHPFISVAPNSVTANHAPLKLPDDLIEAGFNSLGNWSDFASINAGEQKIPYATRILFISSFKNTSTRRKALYNAGVIPIFDPEFVSHAQTTALNDVVPLSTDPWIIGIYTDNEMPIYSNTKYGDLLERFLEVQDTYPNDPNYLAAKNWLEKRGKTENNYSELDKEVFHGYVMGTYSRIVNNALKQYAPNLLNLGTRLHGAAKTMEYIYSAVAPHVDVISVNYYGEYQPDFSKHLDVWLDRSNKPYIISEFYAKGADAGLAISEGAGQAVPTQSDRAIFYENWTLRLLQHRACVGWQWHRFQDKAAPEDNTDDSNKGFVSHSNIWYEPLKSTVTRVSKDLYNLKDYMSNEYKTSTALEQLPLISNFESSDNFDTYITNYLASADEDWSIMSNHTEKIWNGFQDAPQGATYTAQVVDDAKGEAAVKITMPMDAANTVAVLKSFPANMFGLRPGSYKLSFYAKTDESGVSDGGNFVGMQNANTQFYTLSSTYEKYEGYVTIGETDEDNCFKIFFNTPASGISKEYNVWLDDITIENDERQSSMLINTQNTALRIYPNPTQQLLYIESKEPLKDVKIYALTGIQIMSIAEVNGAIDLSALSQGMYILNGKINNEAISKLFSKH